MKKAITPILMLVLGLYLILMFMNMSTGFDKVSEDVIFTAVGNTSVEETLYVHQLIFEITDIHIDGVHQIVGDVLVSINTIEDGSIILVANATGSGDIIEITYVYQEPSSEFTNVFIDVIPLVMIVLFFGALGYAVIRKR